jgi:hypothetical protein
MAILPYGSTAFWLLGYPEAAISDSELALANSRDIGHAPTLMYVLTLRVFVELHSGNCAT